MIFVIAENYSQARDWMAEKGLNPLTTARYVNEYYVLMGLERGLKYVLLGDYESRNDWTVLEQGLLIKGVVLVDKNNLKKT